MIRRSLLVSLLPALMATNCDPVGTTPATPTALPSTTAIAVCGGDSASWRVVTDRRLVGDTLTLDAEYFGGCATHEFTLCWEGGWITLPDQPVQMRMMLDHWANNDTCNDHLSESFSFDLTDIKEQTLDWRPSLEELVLVFEDEAITWRLQ